MKTEKTHPYSYLRFLQENYRKIRKKRKEFYST